MTDGERLRYENSAMVLNAMREMWQRSYSLHSASGMVSKMRIGEYYKTMSVMFSGEKSIRQTDDRNLSNVFFACICYKYLKSCFLRKIIDKKLVQYANA